VLFIDIENSEGRIGVAQENIVIQRVAKLGGKKINVLLREVEMIIIESLEVILEEALGDLLVQLHAAVVPLLEQPPDGDFDLPRIGRIGPEAGCTKRQGQCQGRAKGEKIFHRTGGSWETADQTDRNQ